MLAAKRRRKLKAAQRAATAPEQVYDRRATDLLRNADVAAIEVADPYATEPGGKIVVLRTLRDDPLARMHDRRQIDDALFMAGRHWQKAYELAEIGGARAIDTTKEAVDGGFIPEPFTDAQRRAVADLARASRAVGLLGDSILRDVLANRMFPEQLAASRGFDNQRSIDFYARRFRECLEEIAIVFGYAMRRGN